MNPWITLGSVAILMSVSLPTHEHSGHSQLLVSSSVSFFSVLYFFSTGLLPFGLHLLLVILLLLQLPNEITFLISLSDSSLLVNKM